VETTIGNVESGVPSFRYPISNPSCILKTPKRSPKSGTSSSANLLGETRKGDRKRGRTDRPCRRVVCQSECGGGEGERDLGDEHLSLNQLSKLLLLLLKNIVMDLRCCWGGREGGGCWNLQSPGYQTCEGEWKSGNEVESTEGWISERPGPWANRIPVPASFYPTAPAIRACSQRTL
jgi:hypothetical protein